MHNPRTTVEQLQSCIEVRRGPPAHIAALFVALLRSQGLLTRTVWSMDPLSLRPTVRQGPPSAAEAPASRRRRPSAPGSALPAAKDVAAQPGLQSKEAAANHGLPLQPAVDSGHPTAHAKGGAPAQGSGAVQATSAGSKAQRPSKRQRTSKSAGAVAGDADQVSSQPHAPGSTDACKLPARGDGQSIAAGANTDAANVPVTGQKKQKKNPKGSAAKLASGASDDPATMPRPAQSADLSTQQAPMPATAQPSNKGDKEFERQMQMALEATAAATKPPGPPEASSSTPKNSAAHTSSSLWRSALQESASLKAQKAADGHAWASATHQMPTFWVEVYCGSAATGRWVPVDPLLGWLDAADRVDSGTARSRPLAYVVAFQKVLGVPVLGCGLHQSVCRFANECLAGVAFVATYVTVTFSIVFLDACLDAALPLVRHPICICMRCGLAACTGM